MILSGQKYLPGLFIQKIKETVIPFLWTNGVKYGIVLYYSRVFRKNQIFSFKEYVKWVN